MPDTRVTKAALLDWAAQLSGQSVATLDDLRSGVVLLRTFLRVFPKLAERPLKFKMQPRWDWEIALNWDAVEQCCIALSLPADMVDRPGLQACRFRAVYNLLVALYFMYHVARDRDFAADFAAVRPRRPSNHKLLADNASIFCSDFPAGGNAPNRKISRGVDVTR